MPRQKSAEKKPKASGAAYQKGEGLVAVALYVTPEERDAIRVAAARTRCRSMGQFARLLVTSAAAKLQDGKDTADGLKKILEFLETF
jgi:hypothetical protein